MKVDAEVMEALVGLTASLIGDDGLEYPDPTNQVIEVGARRFSLEEQIERILRTRVSMQAREQQAETFDEANDFDVPDEDPLPMSGFEHEDMVEETYVPPPAPPAAETEAPVEPESPQLDVD